MSALTRARTWSTNRHDQEQAARQVSSATTATTTTTRLNTEYVAVARDGRLVKDTTYPDPEPIAHPTFLQPRVAAVLGVSESWHPVLFSLRLLSILPSIYLCFPVAIRFLLKLHAFATSDGAGAAQGRTPAEDRLLLTETMLAIVWCGCSGYLSFFFTDCLMSRW
jgi:hypothetical protein